LPLAGRCPKYKGWRKPWFLKKPPKPKPIKLSESSIVFSALVEAFTAIQKIHGSDCFDLQLALVVCSVSKYRVYAWLNKPKNREALATKLGVKKILYRQATDPPSTGIDGLLKCLREGGSSRRPSIIVER
jgi:hypothetical protein